MLDKNHLLVLILLIGSSLLVFSKSAQKETRNYLVKVKHKTRELEVQLCFDQAPRYMYATTTVAKNLLVNPRWKDQTGEIKLTQKNNRIPLPEGQPGCLNYQINAKKTTGRLKSKAFENQHPEGFILPISSWLWLTADFSPAGEQQIDFKHDHNINVSAPWKLINRSNNTSSYLMKHTPDNWGGYVAFGKFEIINLE
ncbi:MAG: hypothetical protein L3J52_00390, partial [Proteobacteria bacterium]|nr:hypothetical protein [Pseudomonadota bacterium]